MLFIIQGNIDGIINLLLPVMQIEQLTVDSWQFKRTKAVKVFSPRIRLIKNRI